LKVGRIVAGDEGASFWVASKRSASTMQGMNRVDRLLALILFLQSRRVVTAEQMAAHFELSVRTIYRDLVALGEAGVPILAEAGVGYTLMRGYLLPPVNFTAEEASALVTGGLLVEQFADAAVKAHMHSALLKVRAILPRDHQERIARLEHGLATTANVKPPVQADLSLLQQALADRRILRFTYQGAGRTKTTERIAEPLGLIHYLERWHLIAWCRSSRDYRDFRTDRMSDVAALRETFTPREDFSLPQYIRGMPAPTLRARVRFTPLAADRAKREWWLGVLDEKQSAAGRDLTLAAVEWERLVGWLLSFGREAVVLAPASLRKLLVEAAERAAMHHA
jgi:predicted DNA-binding transcriptional regulator YafY